VTHPLTARLDDYLGAQRWFSGKGRDYTVEAIRVQAWLGEPAAGTRVAVCLVDVSAGAGSGITDVYLGPSSYRTERQGQIEGAYVG